MKKQTKYILALSIFGGLYLDRIFTHRLKMKLFEKMATEKLQLAMDSRARIINWSLQHHRFNDRDAFIDFVNDDDIFLNAALLTTTKEFYIYEDD